MWCSREAGLPRLARQSCCRLPSTCAPGTDHRAQRLRLWKSVHTSATRCCRTGKPLQCPAAGEGQQMWCTQTLECHPGTGRHSKRVPDRHKGLTCTTRQRSQPGRPHTVCPQLHGLPEKAELQRRQRSVVEELWGDRGSAGTLRAVAAPWHHSGGHRKTCIHQTQKNVRCQR